MKAPIFLDLVIPPLDSERSLRLSVDDFLNSKCRKNPAYNQISPKGNKNNRNVKNNKFNQATTNTLKQINVSPRKKENDNRLGKRDELVETSLKINENCVDIHRIIVN